MHHTLPPPKSARQIISNCVSYWIQAPEFKVLRLATTYDFTVDDVLKALTDGVNNFVSDIKSPGERAALEPCLELLVQAKSQLDAGDVEESKRLVRRMHDKFKEVVTKSPNRDSL